MKKRYKKKESKSIFKFSFFLMSCVICGLLVKINEKEPFLTAEVVQNFKIQDIHKLFFWEHMFHNDESVNAQVNYQLLKNDTYTNGSTQVTSIFDGVILKVEDTKVLVLCDNGIQVSYEKMEHVEVKKDERILAGDSLGAMKENVDIKLTLNDDKITLQEAYKINAD